MPGCGCELRASSRERWTLEVIVPDMHQEIRVHLCIRGKKNARSR